MKRFAILLLLAVFLIGCEKEQKITVYSLMKNPGTTSEDQWGTLSPKVYYIRDGNIILNTNGAVVKFKDCTIATIDHWEVRYSDGSGSFGVRDGKYWEFPYDVRVKTVSRLEWARIKAWEIRGDKNRKPWDGFMIIIGIYDD